MSYNLFGKKFGRLTVIDKDPNSGGAGNELWWVCGCECGKVLTIRSYCLRKGGQTSCGCHTTFLLGNKLAEKHGKHNTRTYHTWEGMKQRCTNPNYPNYKYYGAKGVTVCTEWEYFENFLAYMGERPKGMSLDRIDPFGDYEPNNCRWATPTEQANNKRNSRRS